jgi:hypothetical protein
VQVVGNNDYRSRLSLANCTGSKSQPGTQAFVSGVDPNPKRLQTAATSGSSFCVDVSGGGTTTGSIVILWSCGTGNNQKWTQDALGRWSPAHAPGMCLDTDKGNMTIGTLFVINKCSNATSQVLVPSLA